MFSTWPFVRYQSREHDNLKMNEQIFLQISTSGPRGTEMKRSTLGVRMSKFKVTRRRSQICRPGRDVILDSFGRVGFLAQTVFTAPMIYQ